MIASSFLAYSWVPVTGLARGVQFCSFLYFIIISIVKAERVSVPVLCAVLVFFVLLIIQQINNFTGLIYIIYALVTIAGCYCARKQVDFEKSIFASLIVARILMLVSVFAVFFYPLGATSNIHGDISLQFGSQLRGAFNTVNYFYTFLPLYFFSLMFSIQLNLTKFNLVDATIIILLLLAIFQYPLVNRTFLLSIFIFLIASFNYKKRIHWLVMIILFLGSSFLFFYLSFELDSVFKTVDFLEFGIFGNRTYIWYYALQSVLENKLYFHGAGIGVEKNMLGEYYIEKGNEMHAHSSLFSAIIELGLFTGSLTILFLLSLGFINAVKIRRRLSVRADIFLMVLLPFIFFDTSIQKPTNFLFPYFFLFFIFIGISKKHEK